MRRILIVGGGVIGASVAWHAAQRGLGEVIVLERDRLGSGTTWHSAGNITWKPVPDSDAPIKYMLDLLPRLERESGLSTGWLRTGRLFVARSDGALRDFEHHARAAEERGFGGGMLEPGEVRRHHPLTDRTPSPAPGSTRFRDGSTPPISWPPTPAQRAGAAPASRSSARCGGSSCETRGFMGWTPTGASTRRMRWSSRPDSGPAGSSPAPDSRLPTAACEHFYAIAAPVPALSRDTPSFICAEDLIYGREEVGGFLVGFFDRDAKCLDVATLPEPFTFTLLEEDWDQVADYYRSACEIFPALTDAPIRNLVNGPESFTPDGRPLIGPVEGVDGLYLACAMNSSGVTYSGMAGHGIADWIEGAPLRFTEFDCRPQRFDADESDPARVDARMPDAPSNFYRVHNAAVS